MKPLLSNFFLTFFAGAALVIGAVFMPGAVTPASAGPNVNVRPKVLVVPKLRLRAVPPKVQNEIAPLPPAGAKKKTQESVPSTRQTAVPLPRDMPGRNDAGENPTGFDNADFARNAEKIAELAEIRLFKEHIEAIQGMLDISGLGGATGVPGIDEWGTNSGEDENPIKIPGADGGPLDGSSDNTDSAGRRGPGAGPDYSDVAADLLGRHSKDPYSGMGGKVAAPGSPSDALGGIASRVTVTRTAGGTWRQSANGDESRTTYYYLSDGSRVVTRDEIAFRGGRLRATTTIVDIVNGEVKSFTVTSPPSDVPEKGSGDAKDIAKQQDPYSAGVVVWIPPSCGSAECNSVRDLLKNPKGSLLQAFGKGTRVHGDREGAGSGAGTTHQLTIDQHGLVVSYGADSGPPGADGGRVQRFDKSKFQSD